MTPQNLQVVKKDVWYKEPWLILVMGGPLLVVIAAIATAFIAFRGADQVVASDYYKQGLMINTNLERDANARKWQMKAKLEWNIDQSILRMDLSSLEALPSEVQMSLASSGNAVGSVNEIVRRLKLKKMTDGIYEANVAQELKNAKDINWKTISVLHVKLETTYWRLTGDWYKPTETTLELKPN